MQSLITILQFHCYCLEAKCLKSLRFLHCLVPQHRSFAALGVVERLDQSSAAAKDKCLDAMAFMMHSFNNDVMEVALYGNVMKCVRTE